MTVLLDFSLKPNYLKNMIVPFMFSNKRFNNTKLINKNLETVHKPLKYSSSFMIWDLQFYLIEVS